MITEEQPKNLEDFVVPCDMYKVCSNYEEYKCSSSDFRNQCRKLDDYYWKGGEDK